MPEIGDELGSGANQKARIRQAERWFTTAGQRRSILPLSVVGHDWLDYRNRRKTRGKLTLCMGLSEDGLEWEREGGTPTVYVDSINGTLLQAADRCVDIIHGLANIDEYIMGSWFQIRIIPTRGKRWNVEIHYMSSMGADSGNPESYPGIVSPLDDYEETDDDKEDGDEKPRYAHVDELIHFQDLTRDRTPAAKPTRSPGKRERRKR